MRSKDPTRIHKSSTMQYERAGISFEIRISDPWRSTGTTHAIDDPEAIKANVERKRKELEQFALGKGVENPSGFAHYFASANAAAAAARETIIWQVTRKYRGRFSSLRKETEDLLEQEQAVYKAGKGSLSKMPFYVKLVESLKNDVSLEKASFIGVLKIIYSELGDYSGKRLIGDIRAAYRDLSSILFMEEAIEEFLALPYKRPEPKDWDMIHEEGLALIKRGDAFRRKYPLNSQGVNDFLHEALNDKGLRGYFKMVLEGLICSIAQKVEPDVVKELFYDLTSYFRANIELVVSLQHWYNSVLFSRSSSACDDIARAFMLWNALEDGKSSVAMAFERFIRSITPKAEFDGVEEFFASLCDLYFRVSAASASNEPIDRNDIAEAIGIWNALEDGSPDVIINQLLNPPPYHYRANTTAEDVHFVIALGIVTTNFDTALRVSSQILSRAEKVRAGALRALEGNIEGISVSYIKSLPHHEEVLKHFSINNRQELQVSPNSTKEQALDALVRAEIEKMDRSALNVN